MIYKSDINEIPLSVFIEVYTNENNDIEFDVPKEEAVAKVITEYMNIVGGKQIASEVINANRVLNLTMLVQCMNVCDNLILLGKWKEVCGVLDVLGFRLKEDEHEKIKTRVKALLAKAEYDLSKEEKERAGRKDEYKKPTKEQFTKERVSIMKYNKMQIDINTMTAGEYAWLVKQTCDEIEELNKIHNKK